MVGKAKIQFPLDYLAQALHLPEDARIELVEQGIDGRIGRYVWIVLSSPNFPAVYEGELTMTLHAEAVDFYTWGME